MASPLKQSKQAVDLGAPGKIGSRVRRDPPPKVKQLSLAERNERDRRMGIAGIIVFALALFAIILGFSSWAGWSPRNYTIHIDG